MVVVNLKGGLGNQMFQYAFGRALSEKCGKDLVLNTNFYHKKIVRKFIKGMLIFLNYLIKEGSFLGGIKELKQNQRKYDLKYFLLEKKIKKNRNIFLPIKEERFEFIFDEKMISCDDNCSYSGYFNNEKYFINIANEIREDFRLLPKYEKKLPDLLKNDIVNNNSVSIHVRRGDYITSSATNSFHGICDLDYYNKAIDFMISQLDNCKFFVFSDDINWCRENLIFPEHRQVVFVFGLKNYEDLTMMSFCKHNIIANSTFSWWGAWLNKNSEKIVVAPKKWLECQDFDCSDVVPQSWFKL